MELHGAELVVSSPGNYAFERVKEQFINAREIIVITYGISLSDDKTSYWDNTLHDLMKLNMPRKITIVSNIPGPFTEENLAAHLKKLNPGNFACETDIRFNFDNHSKIIMTNKIAYVGSANFSYGTKYKWECGFITENRTDLATIEKHAKEIIEASIITHNVEYVGFSYRLKNITNKIHDLFHMFTLTCDQYTTNHKFNEQSLQRIMEAGGEYQARLMELVTPVKNLMENAVKISQDDKITIQTDLVRISACNDAINIIFKLEPKQFIEGHLLGNTIDDIPENAISVGISWIHGYMGNIYSLMEVCIVLMNEIRRVLTPYHNKEFGAVEKRYFEVKERNEKKKKR